MEPTKSQIWSRTISNNLKNSFDSLAQIEHKLTSGEAREYQILDILKYILPKRYALEKNVVIINSKGDETIKFDGAIIDDNNWPMLFANAHLIISPIESVKIVFEVKSNLGKTEIDKLYSEAINLGTPSGSGAGQYPKVAGFAYQCANIKLSYFDFAYNFINSSNYPALVAILNVGIFCFLQADGVISKAPDKSCKPILLQTGQDTLLVFIYLLTDHISDELVANVTRRYSRHLYESMQYFCFENSFLDAIKGNPNELRNAFKGDLDNDINETYKQVVAKFL